MLYQMQFTTSSRCFIGVETTVYYCNNFGSEGKPMLYLSVGSLSNFAFLDTYDMDAIAIAKQANFRYFIMYLAISQQQDYQRLF